MVPGIGKDVPEREDIVSGALADAKLRQMFPTSETNIINRPLAVLCLGTAFCKSVFHT